MAKTGIDATRFKAPFTRAGATSKAKATGVSMADIAWIDCNEPAKNKT